MKKAVSKKTKQSKESNILKYFFLGVILVVLVQVIFMLGGWYIEKNIGSPITGIPSSVGITLVLIITLLFYKKSEYILLGSFTFAFIAPLILLLIIMFGFTNYKTPDLYYSIGYMTIIVFSVWLYYINKILRNKF